MGLAKGREWRSAQYKSRRTVTVDPRGNACYEPKPGAPRGDRRSHLVLDVNVEHVHIGAKGPTFAPPAILQAGEKAADEEGIEPKHFGGEAGC